ncbi:MAG: cytochrome c [Gemmataceae bacterium]|nr:cytochrome c [Gemmata sp.]MDW8199387.1 cytochrome c [Gemmataceae bacterium]
MTHPLRILLGCAALVAISVGLVTPSATAESLQLPNDSYKKAAAADVKFLQTRLADLAKKQKAGERLLDGQIKPALGVALLVTAYGEALGDAALKDNALKVAEAIDKKDFANAEEWAKKLAVQPGTPATVGKLPKPFKDDLILMAVMSPFRGGTVGGLNIERDIRDMTKMTNPTKIDPATVEILAVRTAVINAYGFHSPNEKARTSPANLKKWEKYSRDSIELSNQIAAEAGKGAKADTAKIKTLLNTLNARCTECHNDFRDDE